MQVKITINTGNEACQHEDIPQILRELARRLKEGQMPTKVMDKNGNSVGTYEEVIDSIEIEDGLPIEGWN